MMHLALPGPGQQNLWFRVARPMRRVAVVSGGGRPENS
jgi:hypothetical protein